MKKGEWINGKRRLSGYWTYMWSSDTFVIILNQRDKITGEQKRFSIKGERPEWGNWKLSTKSVDGDKI